MVGEDRVIMSVTELRRVHVLRHTMEQKLTQVKAGTRLGLTARHIRRLIARVAQAGDQGLAHRGRGTPSNRRIPAKVKATVLKLDEQRSGDFGPTLATETLAERHGSTRSDEPLRRWLRARGIEHCARRTRPHRAWRERKAHVGELLQLDDSHHDWVEGRGPHGVLRAYSDDARSRGSARFDAYAGTIPALDSVTRYVQSYGIPLAVYADQHMTDQSPAPPTVDEQLAGVKPTSSFGRALGERGIALLPAHSPQAKGRIERLFHTFQDRLIKERRLAGIATLEDANRFLEASLPLHHRRFSVQPAQATDLHRPKPAGGALNRILCIKTTWCLRRDWTVAHHGHLDQVRSNVRATHGMVEGQVDGTRRIPHHGRPLAYHASPARPKRVAEPPKAQVPRRPVKPTPAHPWRTRLLPT